MFKKSPLQYESPYLIRLKPNRFNAKTYFFCIFLLILGIHYAYKFVILDIQTNKIIFLIFIKYRSNSHGFRKLVIKFKNTCKDINKTIKFWCLKMLNHVLYFLFLLFMPI